MQGKTRLRSTMFITVAVAAALVAGVVLSACGSSDDKKADTSSSSADKSEGTVVNVELGEASGNRYFIKVDKDTVKAGKVTFKVTNNGNLYHEFVVIKSDLDPGKLPIDAKEDKVAEDDVEIVAEAPYAKPPIVPPDKEPGAEDHHIRGEGWGAELTVDLKAGKYVLLCNLEGHYGTYKQYVGFTVE